MTEFENVKDALKEAIEIADAKEIKTKVGKNILEITAQYSVLTN